MTKFEPALDAALAYFANQPGVTPDQVSQLRSTIEADQDVLKGLNGLASTGHLNGFAPSNASVPVGALDPRSGVVALPATALDGSSEGAGNSDLHSVLRVQRMVGEMSASTYPDAQGRSRHVSADMVDNLQDVLNGSPVLAGQIKRAASTPDPVSPGSRLLDHISVMKSSGGTGGSYDGDKHTMNIPSTALISKSFTADHGDFRSGSLTFVIGHEVQHAFNRQLAAEAKRTLVADAKAVARGPYSVHDYTHVVKTYLDATRRDEASAEIGGWNALRSRLQMNNRTVTADDMLAKDASRIGDFVIFDATTRTAKLRPGLEVNADLTMPQSENNIEAMGRNYYERPSPRHIPEGNQKNVMSLGERGELDYPNHYGEYPVHVIAWAESNAPVRPGPKPEITINMAETGLWEDLLERNGLSLGDKWKTMPYYDSSQLPSAPKVFDHTVGAPTKAASRPISFEETGMVSRSLDTPLHRELRGVLPSGTSDDRIAQIALAAKQGGIEAGQIRTLDVQSDRLMMTGETVGTRAIIDLSAAPPPAQESNQQFQATEQAQQQMMQEQQAQAQSAQQSAPVMSMGG